MTDDRPATIDFDAFRREQRALAGEAVPPKTIRKDGRLFELPAELPAQLALDIIRLGREYGDQLPVEELEPIIDAIFGDQAREIVAGLSMAELAELLTQTLKLYTDEAMPPPNREIRRAQRRSPSTSSRPGRSSSQTSSASTAATSAPA